MFLPERLASPLRHFAIATLSAAVCLTVASCHRQAADASASSGQGAAPGGAGAGGGKGKGGKGAFNAGPIPVTTAEAGRVDLPLYVNGLGGVIAYNTVTVKSRVDGQLMHVNFIEGQEVRQGDVLAQIDPRTYEAALAQAQGTLANDQAKLADARVEYERFNKLYEEGVYSKEQLDTQQSLFGQYEGAVATDQANIRTAQLNISYAHITAPISGRVGLRQVDPGNLVQAASGTGLVVITQLKPIAIDFTLPEDYLPSIRNAMHGGKPLVAEAWSRDDQTKLDTGKLLTIDNEIDVTTGTGKLKAVFDNPKEQLWPNQFVNIRLLLSNEKNILVVPTAAVQRGPTDTYVYTVQADNSVKQISVQPGRTQGQYTAILSGLNGGENVVVDGQSKLVPGGKVVPRPMQGNTSKMLTSDSTISTAPTGGQPLLGVTPAQSATTGSSAPPNPALNQLPGQQNTSGPGQNNRSRGGRGAAGDGSGNGTSNGGSSAGAGGNTGSR